MSILVCEIIQHKMCPPCLHLGGLVLLEYLRAQKNTVHPNKASLGLATHAV